MDSQLFPAHILTILMALHTLKSYYIEIHITSEEPQMKEA